MRPNHLYSGRAWPDVVHEVRQDMADYLGEVQAFDTGLGVLLKMLKDSGQLENTLIVVSGDHGAPGFPRGKCNLYDFGVQVPLAISGTQRMMPLHQAKMFECPVHMEIGPAVAVDPVGPPHTLRSSLSSAHRPPTRHTHTNSPPPP